MSRPDRVGQLIKIELSEIIRKEVDDPRIGFITITDVSVSPDLENAKVFVSVLGSDEEKTNTMAGLEAAKKFIRGRLGPKLELRLVPKLSFELDSSIERASKVWGLMKKLKQDG